MVATMTATERATLPRLTFAEVLALGPCYSKTKIRKLAGDRQTIDALEVLDLPVRAEDRLWLALHEEFIPAPLLHEFACREAGFALSLIEARSEAVDPRSRAAIAAKRAWMKGEISDDELAAARAAAWDAAWDAARAAAWDAAWDAAGAAARAAARAAAWAAARAAAWAAAWAAAGDAARAAAGDAARAASVERLRALLNEATEPCTC